MDGSIIYLDNNATTKIDPRVLNEMMPFFTEEYGNASSGHRFGMSIKKHVQDARAKVAELINCHLEEIIFTSGATEAINLAIKGIAGLGRKERAHIVTVLTEHPAVLDTCKYLESLGFDVTYLPVERNGLIELQGVKDAIRKDTLLVSVMLVNNETGVIQPIKQVADIAHSCGAFFMTDATQAVGRIPVNVNDLNIDLMSFSGHKFYGPKGIGVLYFNKAKLSKMQLTPLLHGGGHEQGLRSGTLNVGGIVGLGKAAEIAKTDMSNDSLKIKHLRDQLETELLKMENTFLNGHPKKRIYNTSNICFKNFDADIIIGNLRDIAVSNGSACSSALMEPSHVLRTMGLSNEDAYSSIRFSLGRFNIPHDVDTALSKIKALLSTLSPI